MTKDLAPTTRRPWASSGVTAAALLLLSCFQMPFCDAQQEVTVRELYTTYASMYPGVTAAQGLLIPGNGVEINCMHPPQPSNWNQSTPSDNICRIPNWLSSMDESTKQSLTNEDTHPICLVVTGNESECTLEHQVKQAQQIQDTVSDRVKCLVVYGNDPNIYDLQIADFSIAVIYIPPLAGQDMLARMDQLETLSNHSSYFFDQSGDNVDWRFAFQVQPYGNSGPYYGGGPDNFFWFRIVLFTLLIVSPCLRAAYLWYAGGGRIHFRRNADGRIIGLQVVPPMPHWLSAGVIIRPTEPVSTILTEEQFNSIPTMIYQQTGPKSEHGDSFATGLDLGGADANGEPSQTATIHTSSAEHAQCTINPAPLEADSEGAAAPTPNPTTMTCTLCSICIEDFEAGETLLILPRCQHAFHKDCIHPWLTERQGCCPLCKTNVFDQQDGSTDSESATHDTSASEAPADRHDRRA